MNEKNFWLRFTGTIFGLVGIIHLLRIVTGIQVLIGDWSLPIWFNWMGLFGAILLCIWLWNLSGKSEK